jgi:Rieske Fe-S protein
MSVILERMKQAPGAMVHFVTGRLARPEISEVEKLPNSQGSIIIFDGRRLAVYRDDEGAVHMMSPVCTHMRCIVGWNNEAKTWDCPCHGSRYNPMGHVIQGPAKRNLAHETLDE